MSTTSFRKTVATKIPYIRGTRPSIKNSQLLVSTGCPAIDTIIGGGQPVGTILLLGVSVNHGLFCASTSKTADAIKLDIPVPCASSTESSLDSVEDSGMVIAWRYENLPKAQTSVDASGKTFGRNFDLGQKLSPKLLRDVEFHHFSPNDMPLTNNYTMYEQLLRTLASTLRSSKYITSQAEEQSITDKQPPSQSSSVKNVLRISIESLGSPLWGENVSQLPQFIHTLKAFLQATYSVCLVTVAPQLVSDTILWRLRRACDIVLSIEAFQDADNKKTNPLFADYHGLLHVVKLPSIGSLAFHVPECWEFGFKLKKRKFLVEKLHMPPDLSETVSRTHQAVGGSCATNLTKAKLDF